MPAPLISQTPVALCIEIKYPDFVVGGAKGYTCPGMVESSSKNDVCGTVLYVCKTRFGAISCFHTSSSLIWGKKGLDQVIQ